MSEKDRSIGESEVRCPRCNRPLFGGDCRVCRLTEEVLGAHAVAEEIEKAHGGKGGSTDDESE